MTEIFVHCNVKNSKFNLKENEFGTRVLSIDNDLTIFLTEEQAQELCKVLENNLNYES